MALHVTYAGDTSALKREWEAYVAAPARLAHQPVPSLAVLHSPYRFVIQPIIDHVLELERRHPDRTIAVVLPELVEPHWYQYFLHNQRTKLTAALLLLKGGRRTVVVNVPWCLHDGSANSVPGSIRRGRHAGVRADRSSASVRVSRRRHIPGLA